MNTDQINTILSTHFKYFQGVYPIDLLLSTFLKPAIIIVNFDKHYMSQTVWVALCFSDFEYAEYFDSYGLPPFKLEILIYLQRHSDSWKFSNHRLQGLALNVCR